MGELAQAVAAPPFHDLSGLWLSTYNFHSSIHGEEMQSQHYVWLRQEGDTFTVESLPDINDSHLTGHFQVHDGTAIGTWEEQTSKKGAYKGRLYYGAAQLIFDEEWKRLSGKWVGFGQNLDIKTGPWEIVYIGKTLPAEPMKRLESQ